MSLCLFDVDVTGMFLLGGRIREESLRLNPEDLRFARYAEDGLLISSKVLYATFVLPSHLSSSCNKGRIS